MLLIDIARPLLHVLHVIYYANKSLYDVHL